MATIITSHLRWNDNDRSTSSLCTPMTWNGGHPAQDRPGTCWCNQAMQKQGAPYCMCTPSLAIDLVIVADDNEDDDDDDDKDTQHNNSSTARTRSPSIWIVKRKDTNQWATMGGFVQVGETVEAAVARELREETGIDITHSAIFPNDNRSNNKHNDDIVLFGVYSDPRRDSRRHTVSIAYAIHLNNFKTDDNNRKQTYHYQHPVAADDVKQVKKISMDEIEKYDFFADHQTILLDYRKLLQGQKQPQHYVDTVPLQSSATITTRTTDIVRSLCPAFPSSS